MDGVPIDSETEADYAASLGDRFALELQRLYSKHKLDRRQPLVRIDYRREAAKAPFQFDMVSGKLHRRGCRAIPETSRPALYAVWNPDTEVGALACRSCLRPGAQIKTMSQDGSYDFVFGLLSMVDQFGSVLRQRGRDYRNSARGRRMQQDFNQMIAALDQTQREALNVTLSSLDGLIELLQNTSASLDPGRNGNRNGHAANGRTRPAGRRQP